MFIFFKTNDLAIYSYQFMSFKTDKKSFRPIHHLPIHSDSDSNKFLGFLTLPIPIFKYEYHTDTDTNFLKNTDIPIPIPIIGLTLKEPQEVSDVWGSQKDE